MRYKLTVLLIVLNLALFSLIFYIDRVQSTRSVFESSSRLILDRSFVQGLDKIRISSTMTNVDWKFERSTEEKWDVVSPVHWKANPYAIKQLLFQLKSLSWESRFPVSDLEQAGQSLESYNLDDPPLKIEVSNGTSTQTLLIGSPTEIGNRLYTMSPDGKFVLVIAKGIMDVLQRDMDAFLDRRIFGIGMEESRVIQIQDRSASNVRVRLERSDKGWNFVSPIEAKADEERVQAMISDWQSIDAEGFEMQEDVALEMSNNAIQLTFEGLNERETLVLAPPSESEGKEPYYQAKRDDYDAVFKVSALQVEMLRKAQESLREKRILQRHADDWTSLEIQFGELTTTLQQLENGAWQVLNTDDGSALNSRQADVAAVEKVKTLLRTLEAARFVSDAPSERDLKRFGLDEPQRRITLRKATGESVVFSIGGISKDDERTLLYAMTDQSSSVFVIRPHVLAELPMNPLHYRNRIISSLPETANVKAVALTSRDSGEVLQLDDALSKQLTAYLKEVRVARYINRPFSDPLELSKDRILEWPYLLTATVGFTSDPDETPEAIRFYISARLGGSNQYVGDAVTGLVGTLPVELIEAMDPLFLVLPETPEPPVASPIPAAEDTPPASAQEEQPQP